MHVAVRATGEGETPVRRKCDCHDRLEGALEELANFPAAVHVPQTDGGIRAGREGVAAVGREGDRIDAARVSVEAAQLMARGDVPEPDGPVPAAAEHRAGV